MTPDNIKTKIMYKVINCLKENKLIATRITEIIAILLLLVKKLYFLTKFTSFSFFLV